MLKITIQRWRGEAWPVVAERHGAGALLAVRYDGLLNIGDEPDGTDARAYGTALGKALFRETVRDALAQARAEAAGKARVLLYVEAEELKSWRWEWLCAPAEGGWDFLALDQRLPYSLYLPSLTDRTFPPIGRRDLRALVLVANPADPQKRYGLTTFDAAANVARLKGIFGPVPIHLLARLPEAAGPPTLDALMTELTQGAADGPHTILHVVCHGRTDAQGETILYLEQAAPEAATGTVLVRPVRATDLIAQLRRVARLPYLVFLSVCDSAAPEAEKRIGGLAQRLVRELGVLSVIGMTERVTVATAYRLAEQFYARLLSAPKGEVDRALAQAYAGLAARPDVNVPALYSRLGEQPLFNAALSDMDTRALKVAPGPASAVSAPLRRGRVDRARLPPLSSAWFSYRAEVIPLIGREPELALLQEFIGSEDPFCWWVIGGPAGVGKSRLAQRFEVLAPETWARGFAANAELDVLEPYIRDLDQSFSVVIDYASLDPDGVSRFLSRCHRAARDGRRLRVLLLDRDVSEGSRWLNALLRSPSSRRAELEASLFRAPYSLQPLFKREREIVLAWLEAAGLDPERVAPPKRARTWFDIRRLTDSRPLHLGFAAAALARGKRRFETMADLLGGILEREAERWRSIESDPERLRGCIELIAAAAAMQDLPVPWRGDPQPFQLVLPDKQILLVTDEHGKPQRLPTFDELLRLPEIEADLKAFQARQVEAARTALGSTDLLPAFAEKLALVRALTGEGWRIRPDIISEFFLAEHWRDPNELRALAAGIPRADEAALERELMAAWRLRPILTIFTLDQLRQHAWAAEAFLRATLKLTDLTLETGALEERHLERLSALLFDAAIRIGDDAPGTSRAAALVERLQRIAKTFPASKDAAYRLWKAMKQVHPQLSGAQARVYVEALFQRAFDFLENRPRQDYEANPFELHVVDVASARLSYTADGHYTVLDDIIRLAHAVQTRRDDVPEAHRAQLDLGLSVLYHALSRKMDLDERAVGGNETDRLRVAASLNAAVKPLAARVEELGYQCRPVLAETLVNLSIFDSQCGTGENVDWHYERFQALVGEVPASRKGPLEIEILSGLHRVQFRLEDYEAARQTLDRALLLFPRPRGEPALTVLEMLKRGLGSITGTVVPSQWLHHLKLICQTQWNLKDLAVRDRLVLMLSQAPFVIGATEDRALMEATAQVLEPALDAEPLRSALKATAHARHGALLPTEAQSEAVLKALLSYANAAFDAVYLSFDLEVALVHALAVHHWTYQGRFPPEIRALWPFETVRRDGGVDVTLHRHNYMAMGIVSVFRVDLHEPTPQFIETLHDKGRIPSVPTKI